VVVAKVVVAWVVVAKVVVAWVVVAMVVVGIGVFVVVDIAPHPSRMLPSVPGVLIV